MDQDNTNDNYINFNSIGYNTTTNLSNLFESEEYTDMPQLVSLISLQPNISSNLQLNVTHIINNSNINPTLNTTTTLPNIMSDYLAHYLNNTLVSNSHNLNNFVNNNIHPFNTFHQQNTLGLNNIHSQTANVNIGPTGGFNNITGLTGLTGLTGMNGNMILQSNVTANSNIMGATGMNSNITSNIFGASGTYNVNNYQNSKLSFIDNNFHFYSTCNDKDNFSKGILYRFRYNDISLEFTLKIDPKTKKPYYSKKFLKMINIIDSIIKSDNYNLRSICRIIISKDYYINLSIQSKINIVI